jgi:hypothetical protein
MSLRIIGHGEKTRYVLDGKEVTKEEADAAYPDKKMSEGGRCSLVGWSRPLLSDSLAVHPSQIKEAMERNRRHNVHIEYNPEDGRPILNGVADKRELLKIEGAHDNDECYGTAHANPNATETPKQDDTWCKELDQIMGV